MPLTVEVEKPEDTIRISSSEIGRALVSEQLLFRSALIFCHHRYRRRDSCVDIR